MLRCCLSLFDYPRFIAPENLPGQYNVSIIRSRMKIPQLNETSQSSVLVSVMYPSESSNSKNNQKGIHHIPYWRPEAVNGISDYSGSPLFMFRHLSSRNHPCMDHHNIIPSPDETNGWPVIVFSHGLAGCADMYSQTLRCLSSFGYIVLAIEHEDGSGSYAHNEMTNETIKYKQPDSSPYTRLKVTNFRRPFLDHRINEIRGVISCIGVKKNLDLEETSTKTSIETCDIYSILSQGDCKNVNLMGHSFGGATVSLASQTFASNYSSSSTTSSSSATSVLPLRNDPDIKSLTLLDPWAFSLDDEVLQQGLSHIPTLSILSHGWITGEELPQIAKLLRPIFKEEITSHSHNDSSNTGKDNNVFTVQQAATLEYGHKIDSKEILEDMTGTASYYLPNTLHQSFSDSPLWFPSFITERLEMKGIQENPALTHQTIAEATHITIKAANNTCLNASKSDVDSNNQSKGKKFLNQVRSDLEKNHACKASHLTWFHPSEKEGQPNDINPLNMV